VENDLHIAAGASGNMGRRKDVTILADDHAAPHRHTDFDTNGALDGVLGKFARYLLQFAQIGGALGSELLEDRRQRRIRRQGSRGDEAERKCERSRTDNAVMAYGNRNRSHGISSSRGGFSPPHRWFSLTARRLEAAATLVF
jgi:hypothetical protein